MQPTIAIGTLLMVVTLLLALLVACAIMAIYLHNRWRLAQEQNIQALQTGHNQQLMATRLEVQEQTLQQLMREIHDNIGSSLTHAKLALATIDMARPAQAAQNLQLSIDTIGQVLEDMRNLSKSLNADFVAANGLLPALRHELDRVCGYSSLSYGLSVSGNTVYMPTEMELVLFRMVQEAITNVVKHAQAKHIKLLITFDTTELLLQIADDGQGFVPEQEGGLVSRQGSGLHNLQQRARLLGGQCIIKSAPGHGTIIFITVKIKQA
jgi:two-component system, NarL family, sensor kinase